MDISTSLLAKGAAGALAATTAIGGGVWANDNNWFGLFGKNGESVVVEGGENPTEGEPRVRDENTLEEHQAQTEITGSPDQQDTEVPKGNSAGGDTVTATITDAESSPEGSTDDSARRAQNQNQDPGRTTTTAHSSKKKTDLSKFDQGLIDFLGAGGDIVFNVKKGDSGEDFTESNLTFINSSGTTTPPVTAKVIVSIDESDSNLKEKSGNTDERGKRETLKNLNESGTPWTWSCKVKFKAAGSSLDGKSINDREKIFNSTGQEGLLNILKKDFSNESDNAVKEKSRKTKEKFIKACAKERGSGKNKSIDTVGNLSADNNDLNSEIKINLKPGADGQEGKTDENKLYPSETEDDKKFKELFGEITEQ